MGCHWIWLGGAGHLSFHSRRVSRTLRKGPVTIIASEMHAYGANQGRSVHRSARGHRTRQTATTSECRSRWLLVRDLNPRNLSRMESGEERLALHNNHEGPAQAVREM